MENRRGRRGREKTQTGIETGRGRGSTMLFGAVEAGRKPRPGLKLTRPAGVDAAVDRRGREKTQTGIETPRPERGRA